jgi:hypothetical protein
VAYFILVHGFSQTVGDFNLTATLGSPPSGNDACAGAEPISCGETVSGTTTGATFDDVGTCGTSNTAPGVWYAFTGTGDFIGLTTCNPGTDYDTKLSVFTGSCGGLVCVDGDDDDSSCSFSIRRSTVAFLSTLGETYYILVHGFSSETGSFELSLNCLAPPANDDACDATPLMLDEVEAFNNFVATVQPGEPSPGPGTGNSGSCNSQDGWCSFETGVQNSLWFSFTPAVDGCYDISFTDIDLQAAVYAVGSCGDFGTYTELAANDDSGPDLAPFIDRVELMGGETYYIQVDGFSGAEGEATIVVTEAECPPLACQAPEATATLILNTDDFASETSWQLTDMDGLIIQEGEQGDYQSNTTYEIPLFLCGTCDNAFTIFDSFGDGICCGFGSGSWEIRDMNGNYITGTATLGDFSGAEQSFVLPQIFGLPCGWDAYSGNINCSGSAAYDEGSETFTVTSGACSHLPFSPFEEEYAYANTYLCGDGEIIANVAELDGPGKAWAGIVMRETAGPESKKFQVMTGLDYLQHRIDWRSSAGGTNQTQTFSRYGQHWLRIVRNGDVFQAYTSFDGVSWGAPVNTQMIPMEACIEMGLIVTNVPFATNVTATFAGVWTSNDELRPEPPAQPEVDHAWLTAFPNPTSDAVTLNLRGYLEQDATLEVVNAFGQVLQQRRLGVIEHSTERVDLSRQPAGVYLIRLRLDDGTTDQVQVVRQ